MQAWGASFTKTTTKQSILLTITGKHPSKKCESGNCSVAHLETCCDPSTVVSVWSRWFLLYTDHATCNIPAFRFRLLKITSGHGSWHGERYMGKELSCRTSCLKKGSLILDDSGHWAVLNTQYSKISHLLFSEYNSGESHTLPMRHVKYAANCW